MWSAKLDIWYIVYVADISSKKLCSYRSERCTLPIGMRFQIFSAPFSIHPHLISFPFNSSHFSLLFTSCPHQFLKPSHSSQLLISCHLFLHPFQLFSNLLASAQLFAARLLFPQLISPLLNISHLSSMLLDFSTLLNSSQLNSSHLFQLLFKCRFWQSTHPPYQVEFNFISLNMACGLCLHLVCTCVSWSVMPQSLSPMSPMGILSLKWSQETRWPRRWSVLSSADCSSMRWSLDMMASISSSSGAVGSVARVTGH